MMKALKVDWGLTFPAIFLMVVGLITLASNPNSELLSRQLVWVFLALILIFGLPLINLKAIFNYRWLVLGIYFSVLFLLVLTYFLAPAISGARSWLVVGSVQIQASEFMKAALIILLSSFFALRHVAIAQPKVIAISFLYFLIPTILVLLQPDLGTSLVLFGIWFGYLLVSELPLRHIAVAFLAFILIGFLAWSFGLANYQKERISALFSPGTDPLGINYSVLQSKIAIGSAGFFGKGFGQGAQVQLGFLPAAKTDFIFSAFVEEWGLLGGLLVIAAFFYLIYRILQIGMRSYNNFAKFVSLGTAITFFIHFSVNLGSALGLLPVIGISLPLVSYGGSNLLTMAALIGIIAGVHERRSV
ncbi:MAG: FtsW/RodA/SpoVE family cell cycle protein [Candidatus Colwellbacteria bacterium]